MRLLVIGGNSRLGQAVIRAHPSATAMVRRATHFEGRGFIEVEHYQAATASDLAGFDAVVNCTGLVAGTAVELNLVNAELPAHLANCAREAGVRHFIHVSSFAVFGRAEHIAADTPRLPVTAYGRSKAEGETRLLGDDSGTVTLARLPMLYDAGKSKLAALIHLWARIGWWLSPQGDITRTMMHYDAAAALLVLIARGKPLGPIAAGDPEPFSYILARDAIRLSGREARLLWLPGALTKMLKACGGDRTRPLLADNHLEEGDNLAIAMNVQSRLRSDIAQLAAR